MTSLPTTYVITVPQFLIIEAVTTGVFKAGARRQFSTFSSSKDYQMPNDCDLADTAAAILFEKAEPRLNALLAAHDASHAEQLPEAMSREIFRRALVETAAADFPCADLEALSHGIQSFTHSAFSAAFERV